LVTLGRITATQGKSGELRLRLADHRLLKPLTAIKVYIGKNNKLREYKVESLISRQGLVLIKLEGVDNLSQAEELKGLDVLVPEDSLKPLEEDIFYTYQLVGCVVLTRGRVRIGTVTDVLEAGTNDVLVVDRDGREVLIPFHRSICVEIDAGKKEIIIDPPDGLLDLNEI
jgi:16S rRNA processing protein RimM